MEASDAKTTILRRALAAIWWALGGIVGGGGSFLLALVAVLVLRAASETVGNLSSRTQQFLAVGVNLVPLLVLIGVAVWRKEERLKRTITAAAYAAAALFCSWLFLVAS